MTPINHDDLSSDLGRALHDRADGMIGSPLTLSDVKGRASRIRRRRAIAASAGVAAAIAIIVPTAIVGSDMFDSSTSDGGIATTTPTPNPTETGGDVQSWPQTLDFTDLELGDAPAIPWLEGNVLHGAGDLPLPAQPLGDVVRFDDGWMMLASGAEGFSILVLDASGQVERQIPTQADTPFAASTDATQVLYLDGEELILHDNISGEEQVVTTGSEIEPVGVEEGWAYYNVGPWPYDGHRWDGADVDPSPGERMAYTDVAGDGSTIQLSSVDDFGSCSLLRSGAGEALGETCDFTLDEFSPDGSHVLAGPSYRDGIGDGEVAVLPADGDAIENGQVVFHFAKEGASDAWFIGDTAWEDDEHILVVAFAYEQGSAKGTWHMLRVGLDGSIEDAVEPVRAGDLNRPFSFS